MFEARYLAEALGANQVLNGWIAKCPAHDDEKPSLSISVKSDGSPLLHCFAGCEFRNIVVALRDRGLWPEPTQEQRQRAARCYTGKEIQHAEIVLYTAKCDIRKGITLSETDRMSVQQAYKLLSEVGRV